MTDLLVALGIPAGWIDALHLDTLGRLVLAALLGGFVGAERELSGKPAGLRTNLLICVGAALITEISVELASFGPGDPGRLAAQIVSGIGFIGAGTIIQARGRVVGLTTAATLWVVAAIGIAVGARTYIIAAGGTALVVATLFGLRGLERLMARRGVRRRYRVLLAPGDEMLERLLGRLAELKLRAQVEAVEKRPGGTEATLRLDAPSTVQDGMVPRLAALEGVRRVRRT